MSQNNFKWGGAENRSGIVGCDRGFSAKWVWNNVVLWNGVCCRLLPAVFMIGYFCTGLYRTWISLAGRSWETIRNKASGCCLYFQLLPAAFTNACGCTIPETASLILQRRMERIFAKQELPIYYGWSSVPCCATLVHSILSIFLFAIWIQSVSSMIEIIIQHNAVW